MLAAVALLTDTVKLDGTLSIEVRGQGVLALLMAESNPGGELRAIARIAEDAALPSEHASFRELVGDGQIVITLDPKEGHRYQASSGWITILWAAVWKPTSASRSSCPRGFG